MSIDQFIAEALAELGILRYLPSRCEHGKPLAGPCKKCLRAYLKP